MKTEILTTTRSTRDALERLFAWATSVDMAYAWASTRAGKAAHWRCIDIEKIGRAVIGTQFAQTEPWALRTLDAKPGRLKVVIGSQGTFHPKFAIGRRGGMVRVLLGSSNFTTGGFDHNRELNVLLEGEDTDKGVRGLLDHFETLWRDAETMEPSWLADYEVAYHKRPDLSGLVPRAALEPQTIDSLERTWDAYVALIRTQDRRYLPSGFRLSLFDETNSYLAEFKRLEAAFARYPRFADMPDDLRKAAIGMGESSGLLGTMRAAGYAKNVVYDRPEEVGRVLDTLPLQGPVTIDAARQCAEELTAIHGFAIGVASRLLVAKRPDVFVSVNNGSRRALARIFGRNITTVDHYVDVLKAVWSTSWFRSDRPDDTPGQLIWDRRAAIIDAALYEEVAA